MVCGKRLRAYVWGAKTKSCNILQLYFASLNHFLDVLPFPYKPYIIIHFPHHVDPCSKLPLITRNCHDPHLATLQVPPATSTFEEVIQLAKLGVVTARNGLLPRPISDPMTDGL